MTHVLQVLFLSVFILQVVMHGEESQVPGDLRQSEILIEQDFKICCLISNKLFENPGLS
jgi:hypothetical protein